MTKCTNHGDQIEVDKCFFNRDDQSSVKYTVTTDGEVIIFTWLANTTCEGAATNQDDFGPTNTCYTEEKAQSINALITVVSSAINMIEKVDTSYLV